jgi:hypothetical protein
MVRFDSGRVPSETTKTPRHQEDGSNAGADAARE